MRIVRWAALLILTVAAGAVASPAAAVWEPKDGELLPASKRLAGWTGGQLIGEETRILLELPLDENPLNRAGESCFRGGNRGRVLILWTRLANEAPAACTVGRGTPVFLFAGFVFCDPLEPPPFYALGERDQRRCALEGARTLLKFDAILVTVDDRAPVDIGQERYLAVSPQGRARLPDNNVLGVEPQRTTFASAGYVAMLRPLSVGVHRITVQVVGGPNASTTSGTVTVLPRF